MESHEQQNGKPHNGGLRKRYDEKTKRVIAKKAVDLHIQGFAFDEIAESIAAEEGVECTPRRVEHFFFQAISKRQSANAHQFRMLQLMRVDKVVKSFMEVMTAKDSEGKYLYDSIERHKAGMGIIKASERQSTLLGANMQPTFTTFSTERAQQLSATLKEFMKEANEDSDIVVEGHQLGYDGDDPGETEDDQASEEDS